MRHESGIGRNFAPGPRIFQPMAGARRAASTSHVWGCVLVLAAGGAFILAM